MKELNIHDSWDKHLLPLLSSEIGQDVINKLAATNYHPVKSNIFKAFLVPLSDVKLVIVGQDVYPNDKLATGLAFGVPKGKDSPSLVNIRKELYHEYNDDITSDYFLLTQDEIDYLFDNTMEYWQKQGVLLLNSALTCNKTAGDQWDIWQPFMTELLQIIDNVTKVPFIFLGKKASTLSKVVKISKVFPHPASDSYGKQQFVGCGLFAEMDNLTKKSKIKWIESSNITSHGEVMTQDLPF